jgi:hypothetical protein
MNVKNMLNKLTIRKTNNTMNMTTNTGKTIAQTNISADVDNTTLAEILRGKTVRYENEKKSSVVDGRFRTFKIENVENVFIAKKTGSRCATVYATDLDDGGHDKYRTLHIDGIRVIA